MSLQFVDDALDLFRWRFIAFYNHLCRKIFSFTHLTLGSTFKRNHIWNEKRQTSFKCENIKIPIVFYLSSRSHHKTLFRDAHGETQRSNQQTDSTQHNTIQSEQMRKRSSSIQLKFKHIRTIGSNSLVRINEKLRSSHWNVKVLNENQSEQNTNKRQSIR